MIKKGIVIMVIAFTGRLFFSCCDCGSGDDDSGRPASVDEMNVLMLNNSGKDPIEVESGTIPKEAFGIKMILQVAQFANFTNRSGSFFTAAYACSCDNPYRLDDEIISIKITTISDFNSEYAAESEVSELFKALLNEHYFTLDEYRTKPLLAYDRYPAQFESYFYLLVAPESGVHQFRIDLEFESGLALSALTNEITLQ
jgi:hypothetical protein